MRITEPEKAVELYKNKETNFLKDSRKGHREEAIEVLNKVLSDEIIDDCIEFIEKEFEIILTKDEFIAISNLYPYQKASLLISECFEESAVSNMIVNFFADTRMIQYGDTRENKDLENHFRGMIKEIAEYFGYKTIETVSK